MQELESESEGMAPSLPYVCQRWVKRKHSEQVAEIAVFLSAVFKLRCPIYIYIYIVITYTTIFLGGVPYNPSSIMGTKTIFEL